MKNEALAVSVGSIISSRTLQMANDGGLIMSSDVPREKQFSPIMAFYACATHGINVKGVLPSKVKGL